MACRVQCLTDSGEIDAGDVWRERKCGQTMRMGGILAGLMEFALQILLSDLHISQSHANVFVAEQLHQGREANPQPQHLRRKGMPQPVRCDMSETTGALRGLG